MQGNCFPKSHCLQVYEIVRQLQTWIKAKPIYPVWSCFVCCYCLPITFVTKWLCGYTQPVFMFLLLLRSWQRVVYCTLSYISTSVLACSVKHDTLGDLVKNKTSVFSTRNITQLLSDQVTVWLLWSAYWFGIRYFCLPARALSVTLATAHYFCLSLPYLTHSNRKIRKNVTSLSIIFII